MDGLSLAKRCQFEGWRAEWGAQDQQDAFRCFRSVCRRRRIPALCLCLVAVLALARGLQAQDASGGWAEGSNHFILLIDASGSVRDTGGYAAFLRNDVVARLYEGRIGDIIPAFVPQRDALTLLHFGICPIDACPLATAYRYLANYDMTTDLVHPVPGFMRQQNVTADQLRARIKPARYYRYTALSWAEPMALWMARAPEADPAAEADAAGRTFLLAVTDGQPNEHTPQREVRMLQQRGDPASVRETERRVDAIGAGYVFSDGEDRAGVAYHVFYPNAADPAYFLEAYEVLTQQALAWKAQVAALERPVQLTFSWTRESDVQPQGVLRATLSRALRRLIGSDGGRAWVSFAYEDSTRGAAFDPGTSLKLPVAVPGPVGRAARTYEARLRVSTVRRDSLLGRQAVLYTFPAQAVLTPPATIYTIQHWTPRLLTMLGVMALVALLGYCAYYRFVATHLEIELPGKLRRIRLKRGSHRRDVAFSSPQRALPALTLHTPRWMWLVAPLYRGATVTLSVDGQTAAARWQTPQGRTPELEPVTQDANAFWDRIDPASTEVTLRFRQGSQESVVTVSYPPSGTYRRTT